MVAEENVPVGRMVVAMAIQDRSRDSPPGVQTQDFIRYGEAIVPIGQGKSAQGYNYKRQSIHFSLLQILLQMLHQETLYIVNYNPLVMKNKIIMRSD